MPNHLVIADAVEINHRVLAAGKTITVVNFAQIPAGLAVDTTLANALFTSFKTNWSANVAPHCDLNTQYFQVELRDLRTAGMPLVSSVGPPAEGTDTVAESLPRQIAACITLRTNRAGRQFRGRAYWGGFSEGANGPDGHMTPATKTSLDAFASGYISATNVSGIQLAVAHRPTAFDPITGLPISPGLGFLTIVTAVVCRDNVWDSQRRRAG